MKRSRRSVNIQDVARTAGVSVSTVSRVLNNKDDVAEETFNRVQAVIDELGYTSSLAARGMRSHRTNVIGLVVPDVSSPYIHEVLTGVNRAIVKNGFDLIIYTNGDIPRRGAGEQESRYVSLLNGSIADGAIVVTPYAINFVTHAPLVIIDPNQERPNLPSIISTNREGVLEGMQYLTGLGHRRIGTITGRTDLVSGNQRLLGYLDGLAAAGISYDESLVFEGDYTLETALIGARSLLRRPDPPTAICAGNDHSALAVYQVAREIGIRIPDQLSVIGFDNLKESAYWDPPLTTIDQQILMMGYIATEKLVTLIRGEDPDTNPCILPTRLVVRGSCQQLN